MAQHDYVIANQTGLEFRADLNNALQAIVTDNSGETEPTVTYPGMKWLDTSVSPAVTKERNQTNDGWITTVASESVVPVTKGGTGATDAATARTNLDAQVTLVSGTNIKTINGESVLGSGNLTITAEFASAAENAAGTIENKAVDPLGIREAFNATGSAPVYACRAWVNFNGTGTVSIRASGNVSSITDNGNGDYTVNFTTAMPDTNYGYAAQAAAIAGTNWYRYVVGPNNASPIVDASSLRIVTATVVDAAADSDIVSVTIFR